MMQEKTNRFQRLREFLTCFTQQEKSLSFTTVQRTGSLPKMGKYGLRVCTDLTQGGF